MENTKNRIYESVGQQNRPAKNIDISQKISEIREGLISDIQAGMNGQQESGDELPKDQEQNIKEWIQISAAQDNFESKLDESKCRSEGDAGDQSYAEQSLELVTKKWTTNEGGAMSFDNHLNVKVKRGNFIELWLDEVAADRYIATHLYGGGIEELLDMRFNQDQITSLLEMSQQIAKLQKPPPMLSNFEIYIALIKAYSGTVVLFLPGAFAKAGLIVGPILLFGSAIVTTLCVSQLIRVAHHYKSFCYSVVTERTIGRRGRVALDVMIALTQFSFTINSFVFMTASLKTTSDSMFGINTSTLLYTVALVCIMTPVAWVRNFAKFSFTFILGNIIILTIVVMLIAQSFMKIHTSGIADGIELIKPDGILPLVGFVIFVFEGIGVVMPIMQQAQDPSSFLPILVSAIFSLTCMYVLLGSITYLAYGDSLMIIVTEMLPVGYMTSLVKILFCVNLIFSYSIQIYPTNSILEDWLFSNMKSGSAKKWSENCSRAVVCIAAASVATLLEGNLDKFLGISGALLCGPLALTIPAALHFIVLAKTPKAKLFDCVLLIISACATVFCTWKSIENW